MSRGKIILEMALKEQNLIGSSAANNSFTKVNEKEFFESSGGHKDDVKENSGSLFGDNTDKSMAYKQLQHEKSVTGIFVVNSDGSLRQIFGNKCSEPNVQNYSPNVNRDTILNLDVTSDNCANHSFDIPGTSKNVSNVDLQSFRNKIQILSNGNSLQNVNASQGPELLKLGESSDLEKGKPNNKHDLLVVENCDEGSSPKQNNNESVIFTSDEESEVQPKRKRKKRHQVASSTWQTNVWKSARKFGKEYRGKKKSAVDGKWDYNVKKSNRKMKPRCKCKNKENSLIKCSLITDHDREYNFKKLWNLEWDSKKLFVKFLTRKTVTKRPRDRKDSEKSRRQNSCQYFLKKDAGVVRVCKTMFLNILAIGEWTALNWQNENNPNNSAESEDSDRNPGEGPSKKLRKPEEIELLEHFFTNLPKVESHYCRKSSSKMYLEPNWTSKKQLFSLYKEQWCKEKQVQPLSECKFSQIFDDHNLSLFKSKKDECDKCLSFKEGNLSPELYDVHLRLKDEARVEKVRDSRNKKFLTFSMDLQAVLLCPKSNASSLYFKTKLSVHNLTLFSHVTKDGFCFLWNECEGGLTGNDFASIISHFVLLQLPLPENNEKIVIFSDGCVYQNRCAQVSNALLHIASTMNVVIEQKYLEVGHTQMEVDSIHSTIERKLKNQTISIPTDYKKVCSDARKKPAPYKVEYLYHDFFKCFDNHIFYESIRPGKKVGDPKVVNVKAYRYLPSTVIQYKLKHSNDWTDLPTRKNKTVRPTFFKNLPQLYSERNKITRRKYNDLQDLKPILDRDHHAFYDNIPFE